MRNKWNFKDFLISVIDWKEKLDKKEVKRFCLQLKFKKQNMLKIAEKFKYSFKNYIDNGRLV